MKRDSVILILLVVVSIIASILGGMFWRSEQVIRLKVTIEKQTVIFLQTEGYLNSIIGFDDNSIQLWRMLGYKISKKDSVSLKQ